MAWKKLLLITIIPFCITSCTTAHKFNRAVEAGDTVRMCELAEHAVRVESSMDKNFRYAYARCIERGFWGDPDMIQAVEQFTIAARLGSEGARQKLAEMGAVVPDPDLWIAQQQIEAQEKAARAQSYKNSIQQGMQILNQQNQMNQQLYAPRPSVTCTRWGNQVTCR